MKGNHPSIHKFKFSIHFVCLGLVLILWGSCAEQASSIELTSPTNTVNKLALCGTGAIFPDPATLASPTLQSGIGNSHLVITTTNPQAQLWFDQGLNMLHGFYHLEAYRAFQEVVRIDANCAMGYWGIAMCQPGFGGDDFSTWETAITKAEVLKTNCTDVEKDMINVVKILVYEGLSASKEKWTAIGQKYFNTQPEALAFGIIMLRQLVNSDGASDSLKTLMNEAILKYPDHIALGHYYTHIMEVRSDFIEALPIVEKIAALAPNAAHIVHMPGHIYFLQGEYEKAAKAFEAAKTLEEAYHAREKIPYSANQNYYHNLHYLAVAYSELGKKEKTLEMAHRYSKITISPDQPMNSSAYMILYEGRILPALVHLRFREYDKAAEHIGYWLSHPIMPIKNELVKIYLNSLLTYCYGMQVAIKGNGAQALKYADEMAVMLSAYLQLGGQEQGTSQFSPITESYDIMQMAHYELTGWAINLNPDQAFNPYVWDGAFNLETKIGYDEPPRLMYPIGESLAHLHLQRNDQEAAVEAVALALDKRPKSPLLLGLIKE